MDLHEYAADIALDAVAEHVGEAADHRLLLSEIAIAHAVAEAVADLYAT